MYFPAACIHGFYINTLHYSSIKKKTGRTSGQKENAVAEVAVTKTCVSGMSRSIQEPVNGKLS